MSVKNKMNIIEWCDQQVAEGKELKLVWDGGGDSGWAHFQIDDVDVENDYTEILVGYMYDVLDYGSWAGEFTAQGEAIYEPDEQAFVGTDYYSETDTISHKVDFKIVVPKSLWFNQLHIRLEAHSKDDFDIEATFLLSNGFFTDQHEEVESQIKNDLEVALENAISNFEEVTGEECDSVWENIVIRSTDEHEEDGDNLIYNIEYIEIRYQQTEDKDICLSLKELQEKINEEYD